MLSSAAPVFLFDVDNTLIDNDRFVADLSARLEHDFGKAGNEHYWTIYEALRAELGFADFLGALQRFRAGREDAPELLQLSQFMLDYRFADRLFPQALQAIEHVRSFGTPAILSDGDIVFQPRKIQCSGLWHAVQGQVLVTIHKQDALGLVQEQFPARHYVMIDDKPHLLAAMKRKLGACLTSVFVRQGHYAASARDQSIVPAPDQSVARIGDLCAQPRAFFLPTLHTRDLEAT